VFCLEGAITRRTSKPSLLAMVNLELKILDVDYRSTYTLQPGIPILRLDRL